MTGLFEPCDPDAASAAWTNTLVFVGALLSLIGCLVVIVLYLWLKQHRLSIAKRMIFFQCVCCALASACLIANHASLADPTFSKGVCFAVGYTLNLSYLAVFLLTLCLAVNLLIEIRDARESRRNSCCSLSKGGQEVIFYLFSFGVPGIAFACSVSFGGMRRTSLGWCLFDTKYFFAFYIVPLLFCYITTPIVYFMVFREVKKGVMGSGRYTSTERMFLFRSVRQFCLFMLPFLVACSAPAVNGIFSIFNACIPTFLVVIEYALFPLLGLFTALVYGIQRDVRIQLRGRCCVAGSPGERTALRPADGHDADSVDSE